MWFAPFRRARPAPPDAEMCRACAMRGCPLRQAEERAPLRDRRSIRQYAARQYAAADSLACPCLNRVGRGFLV